MRLIAVKPLYRVQVGESFDTTPTIGRIAVMLGLARHDDEPESDPTLHRTPARRGYRRRDLRVED